MRKSMICTTVSMVLAGVAFDAASQHGPPAFEGNQQPLDIIMHEFANDPRPIQFIATVSIPLIVDSKSVAIAESVSYEFETGGKKGSPEEMSMTIPFPAADFKTDPGGEIDETAYFDHVERMLSRISLATEPASDDGSDPGCGSFPPGAVVTTSHCTSGGARESDGFECRSVEGRTYWSRSTYAWHLKQECGAKKG